MQLTTIKAGDLVLDTCAAPGGKYTALLEKYHKQSVIVAQEIIGKRLMMLRENCQRLGFSDSMFVQGDGTDSAFKPVFNHIIADVPCSGFGSIQKHPDIKWRRTFEEISRFQQLQLQILNNISSLLKPGGNLIYSTCTIEPAENEEVIKEFLNRQNGMFEIVTPPKFLKIFMVESKYIRTFPHQHGMEGSFAVKLLKV
jgi:16S rRNA (cytosine967-C5)-methyltransferase